MTKRYGTLNIILGPMFGEKTTEMTSQITKCVIAGEDAVIFKHQIDTRYITGNSIQTHGGRVISSGTIKRGILRIVTADKLAALKFSERVVGVDEGQFYPDIVAAVKKWLAVGKKIYVSALNGDFQRKPFPVISDLISLATHIQYQKAVCMMCVTKPARSAHYSRRMVSDKQTQLVGGDDIYKAVCGECYMRE